MRSIAVVTAITGGRDKLKPQAQIEDADLVAFLDSRTECLGWGVRPACSISSDPVRNARHHKVLVHQWLPHLEYSLWIDGNVTLTIDGRLSSLAELYLKDADIAVFRHRVRSCIYDEAVACTEQKKDDPDVIQRQIERYRREGYPRFRGLAETAIVLRRHSARTAAFCECWWDEISQGSRRDQLSFDYVAWKTGMHYACLPGKLSDNPLCWWGEHDG